MNTNEEQAKNSLQGAPPQPGGDRGTDGKAGGGWGRGRPVRDDSGKRKPAENHLFSIIYNPAARQQAAPPEVTRCLFRRSCATSGGAASCRAQADGWKNVLRKVRQVRQVYGREAGGGNPQECPECRRESPDGWETGGMSTLKTKKTASRTGTLGERMGGDHWDNSGHSFKVRSPNRRAETEDNPPLHKHLNTCRFHMNSNERMWSTHVKSNNLT